MSLLKNTSSQPLLLVIDDQADARRLVRRFLSGENCKLLEAENGQEGLRLFVEHQPDVILLDALMPVMDGIEACRQIKAMPIAKHTPILMASSLSDSASIQQAFEAGATDYLIKPLNASILQQRVRHFLHSRQLERQLNRQNFMLEQINRAARATTRSTEPEEIIYDMLHVVAQGLEVTSAQIWKYEAGQIQLLASYRAPFSPYPIDCPPKWNLSQLPHLYNWLSEPPPPVYQFEVKNLSAEEQAFFCGAHQVLYVPFYLDNQLQGYLSFLEMLPDRRFNADEIALVQSISGQVAVRLHHAQLHQSLKESEASTRRYAHELEARNRELDAYTYTIAHDLKSPLQTMMSYISFVEDLEQGRLSVMGLDYLRKSQHNILNMAEMIDQLLVLANLRDSSEALAPLDMRPVIEQTLERHRSILNERGFKVNVAPMLPPVIGNALWVQEVLANLVGNAIKYIGENNTDPQLSISAKPLQGQVRYNVQDNGVGIPPEDQQRIYQRFTRLHHPKIHGFGIGLAIVQQLVLKMKGQVGVESALGLGSIFWFTLPAVPTDFNL